MRYLLDTHVFLWVVTDDPRLSKPARSRLQEADTLYVSAASFWEISIKSALGKIHADVHELIKSLSPSGLTELSITVHHAARVEALPHHHADPFRPSAYRSGPVGASVPAHCGSHARTVWRNGCAHLTDVRGSVRLNSTLTRSIDAASLSLLRLLHRGYNRESPRHDTLRP